MTKQEIEKEALANATGHESMVNYPAIFNGFAEKGIAEDDIEPRVNVFTYNAWRALGRQVRKGEHGVKILTWISISTSIKKEVENTETGEKETKTGRRPKTTTVFHISQTDLIEKGGDK